jgi:hypothetical protein
LPPENQLMKRICTLFLFTVALIIADARAYAQTDTIPAPKDTIPVLKDTLQVLNDTIPVRTDTTPANASVDPALLAIFDAKTPRKYIIADIKVTGNKIFDPAIVISVSGMAVGDEVTIPGGDQFAKAISRLWSQNMFTNINIYITKLEERNIWV